MRLVLVGMGNPRDREEGHIMAMMIDMVITEDIKEEAIIGVHHINREAIVDVAIMVVVEEQKAMINGILLIIGVIMPEDRRVRPNIDTTIVMNLITKIAETTNVIMIVDLHIRA